jgi:hypothetical protein
MRWRYKIDVKHKRIRHHMTRSVLTHEIAEDGLALPGDLGILAKETEVGKGLDPLGDDLKIPGMLNPPAVRDRDLSGSLALETREEVSADAFEELEEGRGPGAKIGGVEEGLVGSQEILETGEAPAFPEGTAFPWDHGGDDEMGRNRGSVL